MKHECNDDGRPDIPLKLNTFLMSRSPIATQAQKQKGSTAMSSPSELFLNAILSTTNVLEHLDNGDDHLPLTQCPSHRARSFPELLQRKSLLHEYPKRRFITIHLCKARAPGQCISSSYGKKKRCQVKRRRVVRLIRSI